MKEFTDQDIERIEQAIEAGDVQTARSEMDELHPADIAELFRTLNLRQAEWIFNLVSDETKADVLMELDEDDRKKVLEGMNPEQIGHFIDMLDTDAVSYTHQTLPTKYLESRSRWSPYH